MVLGRPSAFLKLKQELDSKDECYRCECLNKQDPKEYLGPTGRMRYTGSAGHRVCGYYWPAENAKAVVILVHGHGSYLVFEYLKRHGVGNNKTYEGSWVQALNQAGFSVAGIDNRGCGRSSGLLGYIEDHQLWVDDLLQFTKGVQHSAIPGFAGLPMYLLGSSLGGCLSVLAALQEPHQYAGLILLAPMLSLEKLKCKGLNPILLKIAALLNCFIPTWPIVGTNKNTQFPELQQDWDCNACTYHYDSRVRLGVECIRMTDRVIRGMPQLGCPFLVIHSVKDNMTDPDGSKHLYQVAKSTDKTLKLVDNMWHVLTKEAGNEQLLHDAIQWLSCRASATAEGVPVTVPSKEPAWQKSSSASAAVAATEAAVGAGSPADLSSSSNVVELDGANEAWEKVEKEEASGAESN